MVTEAEDIFVCHPGNIYLAMYADKPPLHFTQGFHTPYRRTQRATDSETHWPGSSPGLAQGETSLLGK